MIWTKYNQAWCLRSTNIQMNFKSPDKKYRGLLDTGNCMYWILSPEYPFLPNFLEQSNIGTYLGHKPVTSVKNDENITTQSRNIITAIIPIGQIQSSKQATSPNIYVNKFWWSESKSLQTLIKISAGDLWFRQAEDSTALTGRWAGGWASWWVSVQWASVQWTDGKQKQSGCCPIKTVRTGAEQQEETAWYQKPALPPESMMTTRLCQRDISGVVLKRWLQWGEHRRAGPVPHLGSKGVRQLPSWSRALSWFMSMFTPSVNCWRSEPKQ